MVDTSKLVMSLHSKGINIRLIGKLVTEVEHNHIREMVVIEILTRVIKTIIRDGMRHLNQDEDEYLEENKDIEPEQREPPKKFNIGSLRMCILNCFNEIFNNDDESFTSMKIWDYISEKSRKKFNINIERDILKKIHLNSLVLNLCSKLNIQISKVSEISFQSASPFAIEDIIDISPKFKDYYKGSVALTLFTKAAITLDEEGKKTAWNIKGGPERDQATELFRSCVNIADELFSTDSLYYARA